MQVLALLLLMQGYTDEEARRTSLLVAPVSLLANWAAEIERFAPALTAIIAHPSAMTREELNALGRDRFAGVDLVITSYGSLLRVPALLATSWRLAILDEAQAIKTPGSKQTRAAKQIAARARIALTGTPIEIGSDFGPFDFLNRACWGREGVLSLHQAARHSPTIRTRRCAAVRPHPRC
jgi:non-specific serine/threonine protein kinase